MGNKVAAVQLVSTTEVHANLEAAHRMITKAVERGAVMVLLPEYFAVLDGVALKQYAEVQGDNNALLQKFLAEQSKTHGITLVAGTIPLISRPRKTGEKQPQLLEDGRVRSACLVYSPAGEVIARYDKMHLFDVVVDDKQAEYSESRRLEAGDQVVTLDTPLGRLGLSICYDLRFPELYRKLFNAGAEIVTVPSAFTKSTGIAHWEVLLRARAIENQCYVIAANQGGGHDKTRETFGHSMIVDPWGIVLDSITTGEGLAIAEIDLDKLARIKHNMPIGAHRRL